MSGTADHQNRFVFSGRWIPKKGLAGRLYLSGAYWITDDWSLGADFRPLVHQVRLTSLYRLVSESQRDWGGWKPAVILGTTADDFSVGDQEIESRTYFMTMSKAIPHFQPLGVTISPYLGAVWIDELSDLRPLAGANFRYKHASLMTQYSGTDVHVTISQTLNDHMSVSLIFWGLKYLGFGTQVKF